MLLLAVVTYIIATAISIWRYADVDETCKADVAIVLGAATAENEVSPVFQERLNHGVWLYKNHYVQKLILTGGYGEGNEKSDAYIAKEYVMGEGIPEKDILIEEQSTITQENLENAKVLMDENGYKTALVVSDPLHMKRAMLLARDCEMEVYSSPTPTTRYVGIRSKLGFLSRELFFYIGYRVYRIF